MISCLQLDIGHFTFSRINEFNRFELLQAIRISDISPLAGLTGLTDLLLPQNTISDVSPLARLINLEWLDLRGNSISDFSPLVGLVEKTIISRYNNPGTPRGGPKMEGPWLWVMVPGENLDGNTDFLAEASSGAVTERQIATNGATEGTGSRRQRMGMPTKFHPRVGIISTLYWIP